MYLLQSSPYPEIVRALDVAIRRDLQNNRDSFFLWLLISAAVVVIGVALEGPELVYETINIVRRRCIRKRPLRTPDWVKITALLGWCLVVLGVAGEVVAERFTSLADGNLQTFNDILLSDAIKKAGDAKASAIGAADASQRARGEAENAKSAALNATELGEIAHREADSVHQEVSKAADQLMQLKGEAEKTKTDLINLAVCNAPRVINSWSIGLPAAKSYVDSLRPMAGQRVFIEFVPDAEARRAAIGIAQALFDAHWNVEIPLRSVEGLPDGVSVQPSWSAGIPMHAIDAADKLLDFLHSFNWQAGRGFPTDPQGKLIRDEKVLPAEAIRIQVGLYPAVVYVNPPGQKEFTSRMEELKKEREKTDAESKRKRKEYLATLPLELRTRLEQADEEWETKIKSETSNGPCQVLNPTL